MDIENINGQIEALKGQMKTLSRKKDLAIKNNMYKNDPEYKAKIMKRNRDYYHNNIRPTKTFKYKKCEAKKYNVDENPQEEKSLQKIDRHK